VDNETRKEWRDLGAYLIERKVLWAGGGLTLAGVYALLELYLRSQRVFVSALALLYLYLLAWVVGAVYFARRKSDFDNRSHPRFPHLRRWAVLYVVLAVLPAGLLFWPSAPPPAAAPEVCPSGPADYTFESGSPGKWTIRYENQRRLGESLTYAGDLRCNQQPLAALSFQAQMGPGNSGQIGLDGQAVALTGEMSAWLYLPAGSPDTLAVRCFVLEGAARKWGWFAAAPQRLPVGQWYHLQCPVENFQRLENGVEERFANPPQFIGFQFYDTHSENYLAQVYLTYVAIH